MIKYTNIILGKGFMGVATYGAIEDEDKVVIWNFKPESSSKAAAGIITESWYTASTIRGQYAHPFTLEMVKNGIKFLSKNGCELIAQDEYRINEVNKGSKVKVSKDTHLLWNKDEYLNSPKNQIEDEILKIDFVEKIVYCLNETYQAENLYVCLGINLLNFTKMIPLRPRLGQAMFIEDNDNSLRTYYVAPYTHFTLRPWKGGKTRIGDTTSKTHIKYLKKRFGQGEMVWGVRPAPVKQGCVYHKIKNTHVLTSGGRVGLGLSGMVGHYLPELVRQEIKF
jgi:hypothetical protein